MRFGTFTAITVVASAATAACSLLLPYDDYPGSAPLRVEDAGVVESGATPPTPVDGGNGIVEIIDGGEEVPDACAGLDLKTDSNNCGACGRRCVDGPCAAGRCPIEMLTPNGASTVMSLDVENTPDIGETLYVTRQSGALQRLASDGGKGEGSTTDKATGPVIVASNGKSGVFGGNASVWVFRTTNFATDPPDRIVIRQNLGPVLYASSIAYFGDDKGLFWAEPKANGVVSGPTTPASPPVALAAYSARIFWVTQSGDIFTMRSGNPDPAAAQRIIATGYTTLTSIAVTSANIYVGYPGQGLVIYDYDATALTASHPRIVSADSIQSIATDDAHVYALDFPGANGRLLRVNLDGRGVAVLASGLTSKALTLAGDYVYFAIGPSGGQIQRTAK